MLKGWVIVCASFAYIGFLFAIAYYADKRADQGRSLIATPYVYALSLGVYATAWTFYGSVGRKGKMFWLISYRMELQSIVGLNGYAQGSGLLGLTIDF